jgi:L-lactate utilization protein LutC
MFKKNEKTKLIKEQEAQTDLNQVKVKFETWRNTRKKLKETIPDYLWEKAVELCKHYSFGEISSALNLNFQKLREKSQPGYKSSKRSYVKKDQFVEVDIENISDKKNCFIELENALGEQFKIHASHESAVEYVDFIKTFLSKK